MLVRLVSNHSISNQFCMFVGVYNWYNHTNTELHLCVCVYVVDDLLLLALSNTDQVAQLQLTQASTGTVRILHIPCPSQTQLE